MNEGACFPGKAGALLTCRINIQRPQHPLTYKNPPRTCRVNCRKIHRSPHYHRQAVQAQGFKRRHPPGIHLVMRLTHIRGEQMLGQRLDPARVNRRIGRAPQTRGFQPLRRHQPLRRQFQQRRTGVNRQPAPLHPQIALRLRSPLGGCGLALFLITQGQMPQQPAHQGAMNHVVRRGSLVFMHTLLMQHAAQFLMQRAPFTHPHIGKKVFLTQGALLGL